MADVSWCGHCKSLVPEYKKAASSLKGLAKVGAVDMTKHESFGGQYGIKGFPTIKLFIGNKDKPVDYGGERTAAAMADFVKREVKAQEAVKGGKGGSKSSSSSSSDKKSGSSSGSKSSGAKVVEVTESTFQQLVLDSDDLWLVEFFAPSAADLSAAAALSSVSVRSNPCLPLSRAVAAVGAGTARAWLLTGRRQRRSWAAWPSWARWTLRCTRLWPPATT